jgi:hypothetical protein
MMKDEMEEWRGPGPLPIAAVGNAIAWGEIWLQADPWMYGLGRASPES